MHASAHKQNKYDIVEYGIILFDYHQVVIDVIEISNTTNRV